MTETKQWLTFTETNDTGKTKVWDIHNADNGSHLGEVKWNGGWRQYVFAPRAHCIWNPACLDQLTEFIREQMAVRRTATRAAIRAEFNLEEVTA